jgi:hypothetical protein
VIEPVRTNQNRFLDPLTRKAFDTREQAQKSIDATVARRNAWAQRNLDERSLLVPPKRDDMRDLAGVRLKFPLVSSKSNGEPDIHPMDDPRFHVAGAKKGESLKEFRERMSREYKAAREPKQIDPARERAREAAALALERALYSDVPDSAVIMARLLVEQAEHDLPTFKTYFDELGKMFDAHDAGKLADINAKIALLEASKFKFELEEPKPEPSPEPEPKPKSNGPEHFSQVAIDNADPETADRMRESNEAYFHWRSTRNDGGQGQ